MKRFSSQKCFAQKDKLVRDFLDQYFVGREKTLFIATVGIQPDSLYFAHYFCQRYPGTALRMLVEQRREFSSALSTIGEIHSKFIAGRCAGSDLQFVNVVIVADDGATVGGRNAVKCARDWYKDAYSDIVIDATGMSRGVCFPLVQQAIDIGLMTNANVHLLVASSDTQPITLESESSDRAEWMHGFQRDMGLDSTADMLKLWVPQLSEGSAVQMSTMFQELSSTSIVSEVCPIIPFPSCQAQRGDKLLFEFERDFYGDWECSHLNVIYAHESNPLDVFNSIQKMVSARKEVFSATNQKSVTVLSPSGWRIGSLGMMLAAIDMDLPMLYAEAIGYNSSCSVPSSVSIREPDHLWHILLTGPPYENAQL